MVKRKTSSPTAEVAPPAPAAPVTGGGTARKKKRAKRAAPKVKRDMSGSAFMQPMRLSTELSAVLGVETLSRPHVVKKLWQYIKGEADSARAGEASLQNPDNKREIVCDDKLTSLFGKGVVNMFEMQKLLTGHLHKIEEGDAA